MREHEIIVASSPHINDTENTPKIMWSVFLALIPSGIWGIYAFGRQAFFIILAAILSAVAGEALFLKLRGKSLKAVVDGSAALTGLLLAYNLSPKMPIWCVCLGGLFAIIVGKQIFGGLGNNIFNPALVGRVFLMAAWPTYMVVFKNPANYADAITSATPLTIIKHDYSYQLPSYMDLFIGNRGGCIGEVCIIALIAGALFLLYKKYITWHIPFTYILSFGLLTWMFAGNTFFSGDWLFHILAGGLMLGAFYMATDPVTSPINKKGKIIFGLGCGLITFAIRKWGSYPEGVSYSILLMNAASPIIERVTRPKRYGT